MKTKIAENKRNERHRTALERAIRKGISPLHHVFGKKKHYENNRVLFSELHERNTRCLHTYMVHTVKQCARVRVCVAAV